MKIHVLRLLAMLVFLVTQLMAQGTRDVSVKIALAEMSVCAHEPVQVLISVANAGDRKNCSQLRASFGGIRKDRDKATWRAMESG
jgi:hypothetical protein